MHAEFMSCCVQVEATNVNIATRLLGNGNPTNQTVHDVQSVMKRYIPMKTA